MTKPKDIKSKDELVSELVESIRNAVDAQPRCGDISSAMEPELRKIPVKELIWLINCFKDLAALKTVSQIREES